MSTTFNLTNSATEVNTALQAVVGADTTPDAASANMVTSQGVFNHVNTELGPFKGKTLTLEGTGIAATDNDTSIPTSAAVIDAISTIGTPSNLLTIKITPGSFVPVSLKNPVPVTAPYIGAFFDIPHGYKATEINIYALNNITGRYSITVYEGNVQSNTVTEIGKTGSAGNNYRVTGNATIDITDVVSSTTNYIALVSTEQQSGQELYGGIITLVKV
jgi:hypothetical protein